MNDVKLTIAEICFDLVLTEAAYVAVLVNLRLHNQGNSQAKASVVVS
jgi:hypothetical protein